MNVPIDNDENPYEKLRALALQKGPVEPEEVFGGSIDNVIKALNHPVFPRQIRTKLINALRSAQLLTDEDFDNAVITSNSPMSAEEEASVREQIKNNNAMVIFPNENRPKHIVVFRRSFIEKFPEQRFLFHELVAEEAGHVTGITKVMTLNDLLARYPADLPEGNLKFLPYPNLESLMEYYKKYLESVKPEAVFDINNITVKSNGFQTLYRDAVNDIEYPTFGVQTLLEELRSAMIQSIIQAIIYSTRLKDPTKPLNYTEDLLKGLQGLQNNIEVQPAMYFREASAIGFLYTYFGKYKNLPAKEFLKNVETLILDLSTKDLDSFLVSLDNETLDAFVTAFKLFFRTEGRVRGLTNEG